MTTLNRIARILTACAFTIACLYCLALSHYSASHSSRRSQAALSACAQLAPQAREPYSLAYVRWTQAIMEANPDIVSVYRYQPEVPNHVTLIVPDGADSPATARMQAESWYESFRDWRRRQPENRSDLSLRRSPAQCIAEIDDVSGDELAWANQAGTRN